MPDHIVPSVVSWAFPFNTYKLHTVTARPISLDLFEQWRINRSTVCAATEWIVLRAGGEEDGTIEVINLDARRDQVDIGSRLFSYDLARIQRIQNSLHSNSFSLRVVHVTHALKVECESMDKADHTLPPKWVGMGHYFQTQEGFLIDPDAVFLFRLGYSALRRPTSKSPPSWKLWNVFHDFVSAHDEPIQCVVWNNMTYVRQFRHTYFRLSDALFDSSSGLYLNVGADESNLSLQFQQALIFPRRDVDQFCIPNRNFQTFGDLNSGFQQHSIDSMASRLITQNSAYHASLIGFIDRNKRRGYIADANSLKIGWNKTIIQSRSVMRRLAEGIASLNARIACHIHWEGNPYVVAWYNAYCRTSTSGGLNKDKDNDDQDHVRLGNGDNVYESISSPARVTKEMAEQGPAGFDTEKELVHMHMGISISGQEFYMKYEKRKQYKDDHVFISVDGMPKDFIRNRAGQKLGTVSSKQNALNSELKKLCNEKNAQQGTYFNKNLKSYFIVKNNAGDTTTWSPVGFKGAGSHKSICQSNLDKELIEAFQRFISEKQSAPAAETIARESDDVSESKAGSESKAEDSDNEFVDAGGGQQHSLTRFSNRLTTLDEKHQLVMKLKTLLFGQAVKDDETLLGEVNRLSGKLRDQGYNGDNMVETITNILDQALSAKQTILEALEEITKTNSNQNQNQSLQDAADALKTHVTANYQEINSLQRQLSEINVKQIISDREKRQLNEKINEVIDAYNKDIDQHMQILELESSESGTEKLKKLGEGIEKLKASLNDQTSAKDGLEKNLNEINKEKSRVEKLAKDFIQRFLQDLNSLQIMKTENDGNKFVIQLIKENEKVEEVIKELTQIKNFIDQIDNESNKSLFQDGGGDSSLRTDLGNAKRTINGVIDKLKPET